MPTFVCAKPNAVLLDQKITLWALGTRRVHDRHATERMVHGSAKNRNIFRRKAAEAIHDPAGACIPRRGTMSGDDLAFGLDEHPARRRVSALDGEKMKLVKERLHRFAYVMLPLKFERACERNADKGSEVVCESGDQCEILGHARPPCASLLGVQ